MKLNMYSDNQKHSFPGGGLISVAGFTHIPMLYDAVPANHVILRTLSLGCPYLVHATLCWLTNLTELELVLCPQTLLRVQNTRWFWFTRFWEWMHYNMLPPNTQTMGYPNDGVLKVLDSNQKSGLIPFQGCLFSRGAEGLSDMSASSLLWSLWV